MADPYGRDLKTIVTGGINAVDLDPRFGTVGGTRVVLEAVLRRLVTPHGSMLCDEDYGFDLRAGLNASFDSRQIFAFQSSVAAEAMKDERVSDARCVATYDATTGVLRIELTCSVGDGAFSLVLAVSALSIDVLKQEVT